MTTTSMCGRCGSPEEAHQDENGEPENTEILLTRLGCSGFAASRGAVAVEHASARARPRAICARCGRQGHLREECTC